MTRTLQFDSQCPIVAVDTETTGLHPQVDYIIQIAIIKLYPDGKETEWSSYIKPPIKIPPEASEIHGIIDDTVKDAPTFADVAQKLRGGMVMCDFLAYHGVFDLQMLKREFERCQIKDTPNGRLLDAQKIFFSKFPRDLSAAVRHYLGEQRAYEFDTKAHDAGVDIRATLDVFRAQLEQHTELPLSVSDLYKELNQTTRSSEVIPGGALYWRYNQATFGFGKHVGESLESVLRTDSGYVDWILRQFNFDENLKHVLREARTGKMPKKEEAK